MKTIAVLCLLFSSAAVQAGSQFCYECSSKSALCRYSVYDGQYLTRTPCSSSCFLRTEGNTIYRGCFDGWLGGIVKHDYIGCRTQEYLGEKVEWCFCKSLDGDSYGQPCNGASRDALSKIALPYEETELETKDKTLNYEPDEHTKYFLPTDTRKYPHGNEGKKDNMITYDIQYEEKEHNIVLNDEYPLNIADKTIIGNEETTDKTRIGDDTEGIEICISQTDDPVTTEINQETKNDEESSLNDPSSIQQPIEQTVQCYACHDFSPYCKHRVTKSDYLTITICETKCFIRMEGHKIYRGCFDGWRSSAVKSDYIGCRQQFYLGQMVEWCFCGTDLCNRVSVYELGYSGNALVSNSGGVHHIAYGSTAGDKYLDDDVNRSGKIEDIHSTPGAPLKTITKLSYLTQPADVPLSGSVIGLCRRHRDGIYADPFDCARFVHCFSGFTYRRHCPEGTIWNDKRKNCDYYYSDGNTCLLQGYKSKALSTSPNTKYVLY